MNAGQKTWVEISQKNILHNLQSLKSLLAPDVKFMAILKSNAYGHGLEQMNKICIQSGMVDWYGADSIDEAIIMRRLGNTAPILVLGYVPFERMGECMEQNISCVAYNFELLDFLKSLPFKSKNQELGAENQRKLKIHIKVETGTARQGIAGEELKEFIRRASRNPNIHIEGIYTHFANIEDTTNQDYALGQLKAFKENVETAENILQRPIPLKHAACSAAIINYKETHFDMVRAGIALYGLWPSNETRLVARQQGLNLILRPALMWKTRIVQLKNLKAGMPVGYGLSECVKRDSRIAILPVGYWDGYDRKLSNIGEVLISGKRAKVLGRICMNMTVVDITDIPEAKLFDETILLGGEISAEELAKKLGTINYEVVTRINPLIKRI